MAGQRAAFDIDPEISTRRDETGEILSSPQTANRDSLVTLVASDVRRSLRGRLCVRLGADAVLLADFTTHNSQLTTSTGAMRVEKTSGVVASRNESSID